MRHIDLINRTYVLSKSCDLRGNVMEIEHQYQCKRDKSRDKADDIRYIIVEIIGKVNERDKKSTVFEFHG